jgi:ATP phosphoribosyltransferase regulatory subunit
VRADTTPQVARIDAHLLNRTGLTRLCYCGPVLHTLPAGPDSTREPMQFGAEIYGHGGLEADLEVHELALECLGRARVESLVMDLADARIVQGTLVGVSLALAQREALHAALAAKDQAELHALTADLPPEAREALRLLPSLYGGDEVLAMARARLPRNALITAALDDLQWLATHLRADYPSLRLGFDLSDLSGYAYYSGLRFAVYRAGSTDALVRGGRASACSSGLQS